MLPVLLSAPTVSARPADPVMPPLEGWRSAVAHRDGLCVEKTSEDEMNAACEVVWDWVEPLCHATPTTRIGLADYLAFIREQFYIPWAGEWRDDMDSKAVTNAEPAAHKFAGLEG